MKTRIVERTSVDGSRSFVIQQKHFLFRWMWVDGWVNSGVECNDTFSTYEDALMNLCYFTGKKEVDRVIISL
jgi:hypothetical protein